MTKMQGISKRRKTACAAWMLFLLVLTAARSAQASELQKTARMPAGEQTAGAAQEETPADSGADVTSADDSGASPNGDSDARMLGGTAILVGAGAYTYVRMKWKEKEPPH